MHTMHEAVYRVPTKQWVHFTHRELAQGGVRAPIHLAAHALCVLPA